MSMLPPRWARRLLIAPLVPLGTLMLVTTIPLTALAAAVASPFIPGRWRPLRILLFALAFLVLESLALVALGALWIASSGGRRLHQPRWQTAHYALMRVYLDAVVRVARRAFKVALDVTIETTKPSTRIDDEPSRPLIVLSRHAGPGDSFLLVHGLLALGRRPRIILRDTLQWAPALDIVLNRVPSAFVATRRDRDLVLAKIAELARTLGERDALVLFPEGRNFTPHRRLRSIEKLEELGLHEDAERAREMRHVLAPRPGGAVAALMANMDADVAFVGHAGLENLSGMADLWRGIPMDAQVKVHVWRVDRTQVPRRPDEASAWLFEWWQHIDRWLVEQVGPQAVPDVVAEAINDD